MDLKTLVFIVFFCSIPEAGKAHSNATHEKHPQLLGLMFGQVLDKSNTENNPNFIGYFSQHHLKSTSYGSFISRMAGSIYLRENDGPFVKEEVSNSLIGSFKANLAKFNFWYGFCSGQSGDAGFCTNLGLSLFTWLPLEVANSYYGISSKLYYTSGYLDVGRNLEIQVGLDFESFIGDRVRLNLSHAFLGLGFEFMH